MSQYRRERSAMNVGRRAGMANGGDKIDGQASE